jgi:hypothetical protein
MRIVCIRFARHSLIQIGRAINWRFFGIGYKTGPKRGLFKVKRQDQKALKP